jgi:hypothetical protein
MPRFVVLTHDHPFLHWDLMLEAADGLRTWRLHRPPDSLGDIPAEPLPTHRAAYLDYEGPVSRNRGTVHRWDAGTFQLVRDDGEAVTIQLAGQRLHGELRIAADPGGRLVAAFTPSAG